MPYTYLQMTVAQPGFGMRARNLDWTVIDLV